LRRLFRWDALDFAYFSSYAMWGYLTTPFLFLHALPSVPAHHLPRFGRSGLENITELAVACEQHSRCAVCQSEAQMKKFKRWMAVLLVLLAIPVLLWS
jgi:hypothetical protein